MPYEVKVADIRAAAKRVNPHAEYTIEQLQEILDIAAMRETSLDVAVQWYEEHHVWLKAQQ